MPSTHSGLALAAARTAVAGTAAQAQPGCDHLPGRLDPDAAALGPPGRRPGRPACRSPAARSHRATVCAGLRWSACPPATPLVRPPASGLVCRRRRRSAAHHVRRSAERHRRLDGCGPEHQAWLCRHLRRPPGRAGPSPWGARVCRTGPARAPRSGGRSRCRWSGDRFPSRSPGLVNSPSPSVTLRGHGLAAGPDHCRSVPAVVAGVVTGSRAALSGSRRGCWRSRRWW